MFFENISKDLEQFSVGKIKPFFTAEFQIVFYYRIYSYIYINFSKPIGFLLYQSCKRNFSVDIAQTSSIDVGLVIVHLGAIVIGKDAIIGKNVKIQSGVTIGMKSSQSKMPIIGDNCYLGTGCKILGGVIVGDNVTVGANAVVLSDIPSNSIAVGMPAKVKLKK